MPRQLRIVEPGFPHHVMHRGNNRRRLFSFPRDYRKILWYLVDALERVDCAVKVHAVALMANHLHLIVTPQTKFALSEYVKSFAQRYTNHRNREKDGTGKLFEARFESKPILDDEYLSVCHAYLELNPVRAGIVDSPADYRWSGYRYWTRDAGCEPLLRELLSPSPWYLSLGSNSDERATRYARWVEACRIFDRKPENVADWEVVEAYSAPYTRRLRRPDGSSAREPSTVYRIVDTPHTPSDFKDVAKGECPR